jgi:hypothetical protein
MIKLAIAVVLAAGCARAVADTESTKQKRDRARTVAKTLAYEAYVQWATAHPNKRCPDSVRDLAEYTSEKLTDPWGNQFRLLCGKTLPKGGRDVVVVSAGEDGKFDTADDIRSTD